MDSIKTFEKRDSSCYEKWKCSGPSDDIMNFYTSHYASNYRNRSGKIKPSKCTPCTNGFISNERPFLRYSRQLDSVDNPQMGNLCLNNYCTVTQRDFQPYTNVNMWDFHPQDFYRVPSTFTKNTVYQPPEAFYPTKSVTAESLENGLLATDKVASDPKRKPPTGVTRNYPPFETISGRPFTSFVGEKPYWITDRPTGLTITQTDYLPFKFVPKLAQKEFPKIIKKPGPDACRTADMVSEGADFPKETQKGNNLLTDLERAEVLKKDPLDVWDITEPRTSSVYTCSYKKPTIGESRKEHQIKVGPKNELLGFLKSSDLYLWKPDDPGRYLTHYSTNFWDRHHRWSDPPFPYMRNEYCRVDAHFDK